MRFLHPTSAMKKRFLVLFTLAAVLLFAFCGTAMAAEDPIKMDIELSAKRFSGPAEVTVTIRVTNTLDVDQPGPMALYYPSGKIISEFGKPTLSAGQSLTWTGTLMVTEEHIADGRLAFGMQYTVVDENGKASLKKAVRYVAIEDADAVAQVEINRLILPTMADKNQKVSVVYEVVNVGNIDVTDVQIKESSAISKTVGKIDRVKAGDKGSYTFTVTMGTKDLISNATVTYQAGGKSYTETVGNATIKYGQVKLSATLKADKKGGLIGDTMKLTLTLKNTGKSDYQNVSVTDQNLGTVFSGITVKAGETVTQEKEITISGSASYQFTVAGADASGKTIETATDRITVTAVDPAMAANLTVQAEADKPTIYTLPDVVAFTVKVTNNGQSEVKDVTVSASNVDLYYFDSIQPGETKSFTRDVKVEMQGNFRFDARTKDQLGETVTFQSNLVRISKTSPTPTPSQVPMPTPAMPELESIPTGDGLPAYVDTLQSGLNIGMWIFGGIGVVCVVLIVLGLVSRSVKAARSGMASDHLERDGYRSYVDVLSAKERRQLQSADAEKAEPAPEAEAPAEEPESVEVPTQEDEAADVSDEMSKLYPTEEKADEATYQRRRRESDN